MPIRHAHQSAIANDPTKDVSSDEWNADHVVDGGYDLAVTTVYRSTDQNVSGSGVFTSIPYDVEVEDTHSVWASGNPTQFVIPAALNGRRAILRAQVSWTASTAGDYRNAIILKNGTTQVANVNVSDLATSIGVNYTLETKALTLVTGDTYEVQIRTNTTGIGTLGGEALTWLQLLTVDHIVEVVTGGQTFSMLLRAANAGDITINVNTTTYPSAEAWREFRVDFETGQWTHFRIWTGWAAANAAGQSIFLRLDHNSGGLFALSGAADDLTIPDTRGHHATAWVPITRDMSAAGFATLHLSMRGSNSTVDLVFQSLGVSFRRI